VWQALGAILRNLLFGTLQSASPLALRRSMASEHSFAFSPGSLAAASQLLHLLIFAMFVSRPSPKKRRKTDEYYANSI
jgi:hypothetical protein